MATKWKNKIAVVVWLLLFTYGLSGFSIGLNEGDNYIKGDYFETGEFQGQLDQFVNYLSMFELNSLSKEEAKKAIFVTPEEIEEHRTRYGDLPTQIANIKGQYEQKIQEALQVQNQEVANMYMVERDQKIADITNNFKSDEHVKAKVIKEKELKIDEYYHNMESMRPEFARAKGAFQYYLKDTTTGAVYSNLNTINGATSDKLLNSTNTMFTRTYPSAKYGYLSTEDRHNYFGEYEAERLFTSPKAGVYEGKIAVLKSSAAVSSVLVDYDAYQQKRVLYYFYAISGLLAFAASIYLYRKKSPLTQMADLERLQNFYDRLPLDIRLVSFAFVALISFILIVTSNGDFYLVQYLYGLITETLFHIVIMAVFVGLTLIQGKLLLARFKSWGAVKQEWQTSLFARAYRGVQEAFAIRSMGTKILMLSAFIFVFGVGFGLVLVEPRVIVFYLPFCVFIGLPVAIWMFKRLGYFNQIVRTAGELAGGNFEADLPVKGKSVLAGLAESINKMKYGVKTSQREQAKSERLKTELITNVSHDLRTPLTSIINYTELLKTPELNEEDREAYIQVIDRKSKRLKVLIEDLFEASKMASGNIELVKAKVDLVQLLQQALAEYNENIDQSTLELRVSIPQHPVYAVVDGQKLWRVFDNLIGNILKYSLEQTRVYIAVKVERNQAVITFKNVTKYELGEDSAELFERFKRGDKSRQTEGSGLGLAIAKSIVDLHDGNMDIEIDGDLFKVTVTLESLS